MKYFLVAVMGLALAACSVGYNPRYYYTNVQVANLTGGDIGELRVQVGAEGRVIECDLVTNNRVCEERFARRIYPQDVVDIRWRDAAGEVQSRQVNPSVPITLTTGLPVRLLIEIDAEGSIKAFFRQDSLRLGSGIMLVS